ncbi:hypothetical protein C9J85_08005 [Haloferax sp. wsp5]|nr:hypothetical protein C9J85_08005 [Haloferax sp. wsp5]
MATTQTDSPRRQSQLAGNTALTMQLLISLVYERAKETDKEVVFVIDEARYIMQDAASLAFLETVFRHHRHAELTFDASSCSGWPVPWVTFLSDRLDRLDIGGLRHATDCSSESTHSQDDTQVQTETRDARMAGADDRFNSKLREAFGSSPFTRNTARDRKSESESAGREKVADADATPS